MRELKNEPMVKDLAMLVRRLSRKLQQHDPDGDLATKAMDYLQRKDLQGSSILRSDEGIDTIESTCILPSSEIAVGHCVILNDAEQPCGRMVAVIVEIEDGIAWCKYLNGRPDFDRYNKGRGIDATLDGGIHRPSPVGTFGAQVVYDAARNCYHCEKVAESTATYADGKPRKWQESTSLYHPARSEIVGVAIKAQKGGA